MSINVGHLIHNKMWGILKRTISKLYTIHNYIFIVTCSDNSSGMSFP